MRHDTVSSALVRRRALRHIVEVQVPSETFGERIEAMAGWCGCRLRSGEWASQAHRDGQKHYAQFRFRESGVADQFAEAFRSCSPIRCRA